jgi:hypothetical protein
VLVLHEDGRQSVQEIQNDFDTQPEQVISQSSLDVMSA